MTNPYQSPSAVNDRRDPRCRSLAPTWLMWVAVSSWLLPVAGLLLGIVLFVNSPIDSEFAVAFCFLVVGLPIIVCLLLGPVCTAAAIVSTIWTRGALLHGCIGVVVNGLFWGLLMVMLFGVRAENARKRERLEMRREPVSWQSHANDFLAGAITSPTRQRGKSDDGTQ